MIESLSDKLTRIRAELQTMIAECEDEDIIASLKDADEALSGAENELSDLENDDSEE